MSQSTLVFLIHWIPTFIFLFMLIVPVLTGLIRGFRKSLILCIQAGVLATILVIVFVSIASKKSTDVFLFDTVCKIVGKDALLNQMGVSNDCTCFQDVFVEWIPKQMDLKDAILLIVQDNGQYLATLANMAVRVVVAIIFAIIYILGVFVLWFIYLLFYPQRRHVKKLKKAYEESKKAEYEAKMQERNAILDKVYEKTKQDESLISNQEQMDAPKDTISGELSEDSNIDTLNDDDEFSAYINSLSDKETEDEPKEEPIKDEEILEEPINNKKEEYVIPEMPDAPKPFVYNKRRGYGALIGLWRGLIAGLIFLSFVGGIFSIIGGGKGDTKPVELDFENDQYNLAYSAYSAIESYGTTGIFKVLNTFKDKDNVPFYLFAMDLVFQGKLTDDTLEKPINTNVALRKEIAIYTEFAKNTVNLLLKYGKDDIMAVITKKSDKSMQDVVISVMMKEDFKEEFLKQIDKFKGGTYFVNLTYSLISSFVNHLDNLGLEKSIGEDTVSLIQLLFKKGYFAEQIPYEKELKNSNSNQVLPYINPDLILNKDNIKVILNVLLTYLSSTKKENATLTRYLDENTEETESSKTDTVSLLNTISDIIPMLKELTILKEENKEKVSGTLQRVYQFSLNTYLSKIVTNKEEKESLSRLVIKTDSTGAIENPYESEKYRNIDWVDEINKLLDSVVRIVDIYTSAFIDSNASVLDNLFNIFNQENENYQNNLTNFNYIKQNVSNSFLLGDVLGSQYGTKFLESIMSSMAPNLKLPKLTYANKVDENGNVLEYGEFYYLLCALQSFAENQGNKEILDTFSNGNFEDNQQVYNLVEKLCDAMEQKDSSNNTVVDSVLSSTLFRAVFSEFLISSDFGGTFKVYVADSIREKDSNNELTRMIVKEELVKFFKSAKTLVSQLKNVENQGDSTSLLNAVLNKNVYDALDSKLIEGTVSSFIRNNISSDLIVMPNSLTDESLFVSTDTYNSEVKHLIGLYNVSNLDITVLTKSYENSDSQMNSIISMLKNLTQADIDTMFESDLLYYSMSNYMVSHATGFMGDADLIIPNATKEELTDEPNITVVIKKADLGDLIIEACKILPADMANVDLGALVNSIIKEDSVCDNLILSATITNMINNVSSVTEKTTEYMEIPTSYKEEATPEKLLNYTESNPWYLENKNMMRGLDAMVGGELANGAKITDTGFSDKIIDSVKLLNNNYKDTGKTKLKVAYDSVIMSNTITKKIDSFDILSDAKKLEVKEDGLYKEIELESLIELVNLFALDLTPDPGTSILDSAMSKTTIKKLLEPYNDTSITNLDHLYLQKISGLLLTEGIEKSTRTDSTDPNSSKIQPDAYQTNELFVKKCEVKAIVKAIDELNIDLNQSNFAFNGDNISVEKLIKILYDTDTLGNVILDTDGNPTINSLILLQSATDNFFSKDILKIPENEFDTASELQENHPEITGKTFYDRVNENALYYLLKSLELLGADNLNVSVGSLHIPNLDTIEKENIIMRSGIFRATITDNLKIEVNGSQIDIKVRNKEEHFTQTTDYKANPIRVLSGNEVVNVIKALKSVTAADATISNVTLTYNTFKTGDRDILLESEILHIIASNLVHDPYSAYYFNKHGSLPTYTNDEVFNIITPGITNEEILTKEQIDEAYTEGYTYISSI